MGTAPYPTSAYVILNIDTEEAGDNVDKHPDNVIPRREDVNVSVDDNPLLMNMDIIDMDITKVSN